MEYEIVIGLEVHVQLKTKTKAFCGCSTEFGRPPNSCICPVCLGLPGSLPVLNKQALDYAIKVALALNCQLQRYIYFDRKNYFYPDLPKNYQISQYSLPIGSDGYLEIEPQEDKLTTIRIKRLHLEEDAGKLIHIQDCSLVDFNRAGIPLLEIVSYPEINSPQQAYDYLVSLKELVRYLEVSDCDMEKGSLRCDANISLKRKTDTELGTKIELKNMNSFKAVKDALNYEVERQRKLLNKNKVLIQETRLWDPKQARTISMRTKEEAQDYRYFPEPDLVPFTLEEEKINQIRAQLPELPQFKRKRFLKTYSLSFGEVKFITSEKKFADFFESCVSIYPKPKSIYNWMAGPLMAEINERKINLEELKLTSKDLVDLIKLVEDKKLSNLKAKEVLRRMLDTYRPCLEIVKEEAITQITDSGFLNEVVKKIIEENPQSVSDYKSGKTNALMFLVGQVMRKTNKNADPKIVQELLKETLDK